MKKAKQWTAILLVLAVMLSLTACGGFGSRFVRAARKMERLQSWRMDMDLEMGLAISIMGDRGELDLAMTGTTDVNRKPMKMKMDMDMQLMGETLNLLTYYEKTGDDYTAYISPDGGASWVKQQMDGDDLSIQGADMSDYAMLLKLASRFEKTGTETVKGSEATVYAGVIEGEEIGEAVALSGVLDALETALEIELDDLDESFDGAIPTTISIDNKSGMVVKFTMDLTDVIQNLMPLLVDQVVKEAARENGLEGIDLSVLGFALEMDHVTVSEVLYDFNAVGTIVIPDEALAAEELAA